MPNSRYAIDTNCGSCEFFEEYQQPPICLGCEINLNHKGYCKQHLMQVGSAFSSCSLWQLRKIEAVVQTATTIPDEKEVTHD